jgi:hypothetical protein
LPPAQNSAATKSAQGLARAILKRLETREEYITPTGLAILHFALGEREQAFASLEKGYSEHDLQLQYLGVDPAFSSLRSDPRFTELLRRMKLPSLTWNPSVVE